MAAKYSPKCYESKCYNLLLGAGAYRSTHRGDTFPLPETVNSPRKIVLNVV